MATAARAVGIDVASPSPHQAWAVRLEEIIGRHFLDVVGLREIFSRPGDEHHLIEIDAIESFGVDPPDGRSQRRLRGRWTEPFIGVGMDDPVVVDFADDRLFQR